MFVGVGVQVFMLPRFCFALVHKADQDSLRCAKGCKDILGCTKGGRKMVDGSNSQTDASPLHKNDSSLSFSRNSFHVTKHFLSIHRDS